MLTEACFGVILLGFLFVLLFGMDGLFVVLYDKSKRFRKMADRFFDQFPDYED